MVAGSFGLMTVVNARHSCLQQGFQRLRKSRLLRNLFKIKAPLFGDINNLLKNAGRGYYILYIILSRRLPHAYFYTRATLAAAIHAVQT